jgi:NADH-ubiquinone oxidoreductase chain 1
MTEHSAGIFVFFFLAEYASLILMCILTSIVLLGGYDILSVIYFIEQSILYLLQFFVNIFSYLLNSNSLDFVTSNTFVGYFASNVVENNITYSLLNSACLSIKSFGLVFVFI